MMNNTYSLVISQSERAWSFQWARTLFALERRLSEGDKLLYLKKYSINMTSSIQTPKSKDDAAKSSAEDEEEETDGQREQQFVPGLMIIKQTDCTRAELRRRIIGHWQVSSEWRVVPPSASERLSIATRLANSDHLLPSRDRSPNRNPLGACWTRSRKTPQATPVRTRVGQNDLVPIQETAPPTGGDSWCSLFCKPVVTFTASYRTRLSRPRGVDKQNTVTENPARQYQSPEGKPGLAI